MKVSLGYVWAAVVLGLGVVVAAQFLLEYTGWLGLGIGLAAVSSLYVTFMALALGAAERRIRHAVGWGIAWMVGVGLIHGVARSEGAVDGAEWGAALALGLPSILPLGSAVAIVLGELVSRRHRS